MSARVDIVYGASQFILDRHLEAGFFPNAIGRALEPPLDIEGSTVGWYKPGPIRRFGFYGRLVEDKGIRELLDAFVRFRDALPVAEHRAVELVIAGGGDGAFFEAMRDRMTGMPGVTYLGVLPPESYFNQIDLLVVPSTWPDPNPFVVVEAYQFGKPVIGAFVGGIRTSVIDGETGLHFHHAPDNAPLAAALRRAWDGISLSAAAMRAKVKARDIRGATDQLLQDVHERKGGADAR